MDLGITATSRPCEAILKIIKIYVPSSTPTDYTHELILRGFLQELTDVDAFVFVFFFMVS